MPGYVNFSAFEGGTIRKLGLLVKHPQLDKGSNFFFIFPFFVREETVLENSIRNRFPGLILDETGSKTFSADIK